MRLLSWCFLAFLCFAGCQCQDVSTNGLLASDVTNNRLRFSVSTLDAVEKSLIVFNRGSAPLTIDALFITSEKGAEQRFTLLNAPSLPRVLEPGKENGLTLQIRLKTNSLQNATARLIVRSQDAVNADGNDEFVIYIEHVMNAGKLVFDCQQVLDFGAVKTGRSNTKICRVHNDGNEAITITGVQYVPVYGAPKGDMVWKNPKFPVTLPARQLPGEGFEAVIQFRPKSGGIVRHKGHFVFALEQPGPPGSPKPKITVTGVHEAALVEAMVGYGSCVSDLNCTFIHPSLRCGPVFFSNQLYCRDPNRVFEAHIAKEPNIAEPTLHIRNVGSMPLRFSNITATSSAPGMFKAVYPKDTILNPLYLLNVRLLMLGDPEKVALGTLRVDSNAVDRPAFFVKLFGYPQSCRLQLNGKALDSEHVRVSSGYLTPVVDPKIRFFNKGSRDCEIKDLHFSDELKTAKNFELSKDAPLPWSVAPQSYSPWVQLRYTSPHVTGDERPGILVVESNDLLRPKWKIALDGRSKPYRECLRFTYEGGGRYPVTRDGICDLRPRKLEISHVNRQGCEDVEITSVEWLPGSSSLIALSGATSFPHKLEKGKSLTLTLKFLGESSQSVDAHAQLLVRTSSFLQPSHLVDLRVVQPSLESRVMTWSLDGHQKQDYSLNLPSHFKDDAEVRIELVRVNDRSVPRLREDGRANWTFHRAKMQFSFAPDMLPRPWSRVVITYGVVCVAGVKKEE